VVRHGRLFQSSFNLSPQLDLNISDVVETFMQEKSQGLAKVEEPAALYHWSDTAK